MSAARGDAIKSAIEIFFSKHPPPSVHYATLRARIEKVIANYPDKIVPRNVGGAMFELAPRQLSKLLENQPPPSPFTGGSRPEGKVADIKAWVDELVRLKRIKAPTGMRWGQVNTKIFRGREKLPVWTHQDGNTIVHGVLLGPIGIAAALEAERRYNLGWMTIHEVVAHPHWDFAEDRLAWVLGYESFMKAEIRKLVLDAEHGALFDDTAPATAPPDSVRP